MEELDPHVALNGPSSAASLYGRREHGQNVVYYDDDLTDEEADMISGTYNQYTGMFILDPFLKKKF